MARPLRLDFAGAVYHFAGRGNARQKIFFNNGDRQLFLQTLAQVVSRYSWVCHAYCLMTNHYQLLVETPKTNLSIGMRHLNGLFTQSFNRRHKRDRPLISRSVQGDIGGKRVLPLGAVPLHTVLLFHLSDRMLDCPENPLFLDYRSIRSQAHCQEVRREFHWHNLARGTHPFKPDFKRKIHGTAGEPECPKPCRSYSFPSKPGKWAPTMTPQFPSWSIG